MNEDEEEQNIDSGNEDVISDQGKYKLYIDVKLLFQLLIYYYSILFFIEYSLLDKQLDDLNSVLDVLEQKNDRIHAQLKALLENSREIRQDIAVERAKEGADSNNAEKQGES